METIYLVIAFIAPGMICKQLENAYKKERKKYINTYSYLFDVVLDSVVVGILTILILRVSEKDLSIDNFEMFASYLNSFKHIGVYMLVMVGISVLWCVIKNCILIKIHIAIKNLILGGTQNSKHSVHTTDWDDMIKDKEIKGTWQVMSLYKDEKYISSGMRVSSSTTNADQFEIRYDRVRMVERLLREQPDWFKIKYEYYNVNTGLRVRMYDQRVFEEHWKDNEKQNKN